MCATVHDATLYVLKTQAILHNVKSVILRFAQNAMSPGTLGGEIYRRHLLWN